MPDRTASELPPWWEIAPPHDDVGRGELELAEFAADLHQVWQGDAHPRYRDPAEFFARTHLTAGLRDLLLGAARRLTGRGGDPVVKLQTGFGGGKTHALIALHHLAADLVPAGPPALADLLAEAGVDPPDRPVRRAVLAGQQLQPASVSTKADGTAVHTIWGEMAWQLGGPAGYELVAEADRAGVNPGAALGELFSRCAPCLVLVDEWVSYARNLYEVRGLPAGSFDAQSSFAQALTDAARRVPGAMVVVAVPATAEDEVAAAGPLGGGAGADGGRAALAALDAVLGRVQATWQAPSVEETWGIVRSRLFAAPTPDGARQRERVVGAFARLYRDRAADLPPGCGEAGYEERLRAAYPLHPELLDHLLVRWSPLERFQRTRGVLRLLAEVVHVLWRRREPGPLVMPGSVPVDDGAVAAELARTLGPGWERVLAADVDGPASVPARLDADRAGSSTQPGGTLHGPAGPARQVARTVLLGTAPAAGGAAGGDPGPEPRGEARGMAGAAVTLGCLRPGERPGALDDALRHLADEATYLHREGDRHWFAPMATAAGLARDRAVSHVSDRDVDAEVRRRLGPSGHITGTAGPAGPFAAVHVPVSPADVPDVDAVQLVILGPEHSHDPAATPGGSDAAGTATAFARQVLDERAGGLRRCRNMLVFLAADRAALADARAAVREWLAWRSLLEDQVALALGPVQLRQVEERLEELRATVDLRLAASYQWVLDPGHDGDGSAGREGGGVRWEVVRVPGGGGLAERVGRRLVEDELVVTRYSGGWVRRDVDRVPLWRGDHVAVGQLWDDYCRYLYLPRLASWEVLATAVAEGVGSAAWPAEGFAYATGVDTGGAGPAAATGPYRGLVTDRPPEVAATGLVVHPRAAGPPGDGAGGPVLGSSGAPAGEAGAARTGARPGHPTGYRGRVSLGGPGVVRSVGDVADAVVDQLQQDPGTAVTVTVEVAASRAAGFPARLRRTVTENATALGFEVNEFEDAGFEAAGVGAGDDAAGVDDVDAVEG